MSTNKIVASGVRQHVAIKNPKQVTAVTLSCSKAKSNNLLRNSTRNKRTKALQKRTECRTVSPHLKASRDSKAQALQ